MSSEVFEANGTAERDAALVTLEQNPGTKAITAGGDKGYDTFDFVSECRHLGVTPHIAQNDVGVAAVRSMSGRRGTKAIASAKSSTSGSKNVSAG